MSNVVSISSVVTGEQSSAMVHISEVMELFQSHKVVRAAQVLNVYPKNPDDSLPMDIGFEDGSLSIPYVAAPEMLARFTPSVGDYVVLYDDDYVSFCPKEKFEEGNTKVEFVDIGEDAELHVPTSQVEQIEMLAEMCHTLWSSVCLGFDIKLPAFEKLDRKDQQFYISRVAHYIAYPNAEVSAPHEAWKLKVMLNGWSYGSAFNPKLFTDPRLVPFEEMGQLEKAKEHFIHKLVKDTYYPQEA